LVRTHRWLNLRITGGDGLAFRPWKPTQLEDNNMTTATTKKAGKAEREQERKSKKASNLAEAQKLIPAIKEEHQAVVDSLGTGFEHALKVGEHLAQARKLVGHGGWADWVEKNCNFSYRTARNYIRLHVHRDKLPQRGDISYRRAVAMLGLDPNKKPTSKREARAPTVKVQMDRLRTLAKKFKVNLEAKGLMSLLKELGVQVVAE
jgi:hypothetical protein